MPEAKAKTPAIEGVGEVAGDKVVGVDQVGARVVEIEDGEDARFDSKLEVAEEIADIFPAVDGELIAEGDCPDAPAYDSIVEA